MALGLHEAPHDPKGAEEVSIGVGCQAWDDGVVGPLVGGNTVGVLLVQYEIVASVLQNKATTFWHYACCKTAMIKLKKKKVQTHDKRKAHVRVEFWKRKPCRAYCLVCLFIFLASSSTAVRICSVIMMLVQMHREQR